MKALYLHPNGSHIAYCRLSRELVIATPWYPNPEDGPIADKTPVPQYQLGIPMEPMALASLGAVMISLGRSPYLEQLATHTIYSPPDIKVFVEYSNGLLCLVRYVDMDDVDNSEIAIGTEGLIDLGADLIALAADLGEETPSQEEFATTARLARHLGYSLCRVDKGDVEYYELRNRKGCFTVRDWHSALAIVSRLRNETLEN